MPSVEAVDGLRGRDIAAQAERDRDNWVPPDGRLQLCVALRAGWGMGQHLGFSPLERPSFFCRRAAKDGQGREGGGRDVGLHGGLLEEI